MTVYLRLSSCEIRCHRSIATAEKSPNTGACHRAAVPDADPLRLLSGDVEAEAEEAGDETRLSV